MVDWYEWKWRKSHVIENAAGAGTGYQVRIHVHRGTGADSGETVNLSTSLCREEFGDIRFTGSDGIVQLPYWMESNDGTDAIFWVKVADNLTTDNSTIYLYYNNPDATTTSNGDDTFVYFDDFTGETISGDLTIFEDNQSHAHLYLDTANNRLVGQRLASLGYWDVALAYFPKVGYGHAIRTMCQRDVDAPYANTIYVVSFMGNIDFSPSSDIGEFSYCHDANTDDRIGYRFCKSGTCSTGYPTVRQLDTWQIIESRWDNDYAELLLDGSSLANTTNTNYIPNDELYPTIGIECGSGSGTNSKYFDWVAVRKYVYPEPQHGDWGDPVEKP